MNKCVISARTFDLSSMFLMVIFYFFIVNLLVYLYFNELGLCTEKIVKLAFIDNFQTWSCDKWNYLNVSNPVVVVYTRTILCEMAYNHYFSDWVITWTSTLLKLSYLTFFETVPSNKFTSNISCAFLVFTH